MSGTGPVIVLGAGPAGLTAAYLLTKRGVPTTVLEADPVYVGGLSRTVRHGDLHFDIGGHRFFSKTKAVEDLWTELLPDDLLLRRRSSRIYYRGKFFSYPLKAGEALAKLGLLESVRCVGSYGLARMFPVRDPKSFDEWVSNKFGRRLYEIFFKTYTEKVWGISCREISADWAAQRIKGLSLWSAARSALFPNGRRGSGDAVIKTLIDSFRYPRKGPGMMWETAAEKIVAQGGETLMGHRVRSLSWDATAGAWTVSCSLEDGTVRTFGGRHVVCSLPLRGVVAGLSPIPSERAAKAAAALRYRDFIMIALVLRERNILSDNWIYIHDPGVRVGRVQNFRSWSPEMAPDPNLACYGLEYFCDDGDDLWTTSDADLLALAEEELVQLGLARPGDVVDGRVVRQKKAYPVYDPCYAANVAVIREEITARYPQLHLVGRNGMHKYNNQDHAMMTAMLAVENIVAGRQLYDVWRVNEDAEYHEAGDAEATLKAFETAAADPAGRNRDTMEAGSRTSR